MGYVSVDVEVWLGGKCYCVGVITVVLIWREFGGISVVGSEVVVNDLAAPSLCGGYGACPVAGMGLVWESGEKIVGCGRISYIIAESDDGLGMWPVGMKNMDCSSTKKAEEGI